MAIPVELEPDLDLSNIKSRLMCVFDTVPAFPGVAKVPCDNSLVFISVVHGPKAYAYFSYLSLASLLFNTDLAKYPVIVYASAYLYSLLSSLLAPFKCVEVKLLPDLHTYAALNADEQLDRKYHHAKYIAFADDALQAYGNVCCLDADLFVSGKYLTFEPLKQPMNTVLALPLWETPKTIDPASCISVDVVFEGLGSRLTGTVSPKQRKKEFYAKVKQAFNVDLKQQAQSRLQPVWYNTCAVAFPVKLIDDSFKSFSRLYAAEPFYCDECLLFAARILFGFEFQNLHEVLPGCSVQQNADHLLNVHADKCYINHGFSSFNCLQTTQLALIRYVEQLQRKAGSA